MNESIVSRFSLHLLDSLESRGLDRQQVCRDAGIKPGAEWNPKELGRLLQSLKQLMGDELLGFGTRPCKPGTFSLMCELVVNCETLGEALSKGCRYYDYVSDDLRVSLKFEADDAVLRLTPISVGLKENNFITEFWLLAWYHLASWLIGRKIPLNAVSIDKHSNNPHLDFATIFSCPIQMDEHYQFCFDRTYLTKCIAKSPRNVAEFIGYTDIDIVSILGCDTSFRSKIKTLMKDSFLERRDFVAIDNMAEYFHVSSQTLRRKLSNENVTYRQLKDEVRREIVLDKLSNPDIPISDIVELSGFSELTSMSRAVKVWTGKSPKAYREENVFRAFN